MQWKVLVLSAGGPEADLEREASLIREQLRRGNPGESVSVRTLHATRSQEVVAALAELEPSIVHVSGPGGELILDGRATSEEGLAELFARAEVWTECVLLNAYFTPERASALLDRVRFVAGTPAGGPVATVLLWTSFYEELARGGSPEAAFERGRAAAAVASPPPERLPCFVTRDPGRRAARGTRGLGTDGGGTGGPDAPPGSASGDAEAAAAPLYPLWFGTNRAPVDANDPAKGFSGERDTELHYGTCRVSVPQSHRIGSIGSSWWKRLLTREDDRLRLDWQALRLLAADAFWANLSSALAERDAGQRMGLVFIHGYNVSFEGAALRAAQIGFDLQVPGATAFFSWPSRAQLALYNADEATIQASEKHIARFLLEFTRRSGAEAVHVIAHSMGNRGLLRAMQRIVAEVGEETRVPFGQILLAAPDEDQEVFAELSAAYGRLARRTTLYVSARDRAVAGSRLVHDAPRVGFTPPVTVVPGIDTVEVTNADVSLLGHGYFAEARDMLHDIHSLLVHDAPPSRRMGLRPAVTADGRSYWVIGG